MKIRWGAVGIAIAATLLPTTAAGAVPTRPAALKALETTPICASEGSGRSKDDGVVRVATFNTLHSDTDDGDVSMHERMPLLVRTLVESGADVIGLQEVTENQTFDAKNEYPQKHGLVARRVAVALAATTGERWTWCYSRSNPHVPLTPERRRGNGNALDDLAAQNGNTPDSGDFAEGLAIVTRYRIVDTRARRMFPRSYEALACTDPDPFCRLDATFDARQALWARVQTPQGFIDAFTTHLAHEVTPLSTFTKQAQMRQALGFVDQYAQVDALPDFLLGDFNSTPDSVALTMAANDGLRDTYRLAGGAPCRKRGDAGCSGGPVDGEESYSKTATRGMDERIDYVLARPGPRCKMRVESRRIGDVPQRRADGRYVWPSDHYGFVSTVSCR